MRIFLSSTEVNRNDPHLSVWINERTGMCIFLENNSACQWLNLMRMTSCTSKYFSTAIHLVVRISVPDAPGVFLPHQSSIIHVVKYGLNVFISLYDNHFKTVIVLLILLLVQIRTYHKMLINAVTSSGYIRDLNYKVLMMYGRISIHVRTLLQLTRKLIAIDGVTRRGQIWRMIKRFM